MTLAPNHLRQLNGNRVWIFILALTISFSSCGLFKKVDDTNTSSKNDYELDEIEGKRKYNPKTGKYEYDTEVTEKMDTVTWRDGRIGEAPPITSDTPPLVDPGTGIIIDPVTGAINPSGIESSKLFSYNVSILLPFLTNQYDEVSTSLPRNSFWAVSFYSGAKMAFDRLEQDGVKLKVSVLDTKASESVTNQLLTRTELQEADLIIGPYRQRNVQQVAEFAKENDKPMVSPYSASLSVTRNNPYYIQVNPSLMTHCAAITRHVRKSYSASQVVLLSRDNPAEKAALGYFQEANYALQGTRETSSFREFILSDGTADFINGVDFTPYIKEDSTTVFIVPSWQDESYVYSILRKINGAKGSNRVVVYGMPQWMSFDRIAPEYFENLNVHVSSASFVDPQSSESKFFKQNYYNKYHTLPALEAYIGYDSMLYFGRMIHKYGKKFQYFVDREGDKYLHTSFVFQPLASSGAEGEDFTKIDRFENKFVNMLKFEGFQFRLTD